MLFYLSREALYVLFFIFLIYLLTCRRSYIDSFLIRRALRRLSNVNHIEFAIVNSVVSAPALIALRSQGIACITLVHEFVSYIKPLSIFSEVSLWSSKIVCSTYLTWHDVLSYCPHLRDLPVAYLPQGRSLTPDQLLLADVQDPSPILESDPSSQFLSQLRANTLLVLGAGAVQPRKGIDHFISIANYIVNRNKELDVVFVWFGSGYEPDNDFNVSIWLRIKSFVVVYLISFTCFHLPLHIQILYPEVISLLLVQGLIPCLMLLSTLF